jgi:hypothetical protein
MLIKIHDGIVIVENHRSVEYKNLAFLGGLFKDCGFLSSRRFGSSGFGFYIALASGFCGHKESLEFEPY